MEIRYPLENAFYAYRVDAAKRKMIVYLRNPRLSLWESWHAEGVTERGYEGPLRPGIRRATSPIGRGFGAINDHLAELGR